MIPWEEIDRAAVPGQKGELVLRKRDNEYSIRTPETELMNSRVHYSEDALAELTCRRIADNPSPKILIGGLGMGFTLASALVNAPEKAGIVVSELIPAVIEWNQKHLGSLTGFPLDDPRVSIRQEDVIKTIGQKNNFWDAILLDVDNGPEGLTKETNNYLYSLAGLKKINKALRFKGILSVWSANDSHQFTKRLNQCKFKPETICVKARRKKGSRHYIWFARKI